MLSRGVSTLLHQETSFLVVGVEVEDKGRMSCKRMCVGSLLDGERVSERGCCGEEVKRSQSVDKRKGASVRQTRVFIEQTAHVTGG